MSKSEETRTHAELLFQLENEGSLETAEYLFTTDPSEWTVTVWEKSTQHMVAYSSTKADYEASLVEFIQDYG